MEVIDNATLDPEVKKQIIALMKKANSIDITVGYPEFQSVMREIAKLTKIAKERRVKDWESEPWLALNKSFTASMKLNKTLLDQLFAKEKEVDRVISDGDNTGKQIKVVVLPTDIVMTEKLNGNYFVHIRSDNNITHNKATIENTLKTYKCTKLETTT